jgi:hypothetical protein
LAHKRAHPIDLALYAWDNNHEQMKKARRPPSITSKGISWGSFSSRHGPNNDDRTNDDCVIIEYSKQVRVFLLKKLALVKRLFESAENESAYLLPIKENLDKMKSDM